MGHLKVRIEDKAHGDIGSTTCAIAITNMAFVENSTFTTNPFLIPNGCTTRALRVNRSATFSSTNSINKRTLHKSYTLYVIHKVHYWLMQVGLMQDLCSWAFSLEGHIYFHNPLAEENVIVERGLFHLCWCHKHKFPVGITWSRPM